MKKVLIVTEGFHNGGVEKSLLTFLDKIKNHNVTILCLSKSTIKPNINSNINIIYYNDYFMNFFIPIFGSLKYFIGIHNYDLFFKRILLSILSILKYKRVTTYTWKILKKYLNKEILSYDLAIAFKDGLSWYFVSECVEAENKILWNHTDINKVNCDFEYTKRTFMNFDIINCVSKSAMKKLNSIYKLENKTQVFYNYIDNEEIIKKSKEEMEIKFDDSKVNIVTVGRLCKEKGYDLILKTCVLLNKNNFKYDWYIIGDGQDYKKLTRYVNKRKLSKNVHFLGSKKNPYPYMLNADIYIQTSSYEGFGLTVSEAKILSKRIIATSIPEFIEQDDNYINYIKYNKYELFNNIYNYKQKLIVRKEQNVNYDLYMKKFIDIIDK